MGTDSAWMPPVEVGQLARDLLGAKVQGHVAILRDRLQDVKLVETLAQALESADAPIRLARPCLAGDRDLAVRAAAVT